MRILIAGGGQVAALTAGRLIREGNEVTLVERDEQRCAQLEETLDARIVRGSAVSVRTMRNAGLQDADMLIAVTNSDESNILACLVAQIESKIKVKMARVRSHEIDHWRRIAREAGLQIDLMIHPETDIMDRIMRVVHMPGVSDILDFADGEVKLFGMNVELDCWFVGKTLEELDERNPPENSLIAMIFRGQQVIIPHGAERLLPGDHIYVMSTRNKFRSSWASASSNRFSACSSLVASKSVSPSRASWKRPASPSSLSDALRKDFRDPQPDDRGPR